MTSRIKTNAYFFDFQVPGVLQVTKVSDMKIKVELRTTTSEKERKAHEKEWGDGEEKKGTDERKTIEPSEIASIYLNGDNSMFVKYEDENENLQTKQEKAFEVSVDAEFHRVSEMLKRLKPPSPQFIQLLHLVDGEINDLLNFIVDGEKKPTKEYALQLINSIEHVSAFLNSEENIELQPYLVANRSLAGTSTSTNMVELSIFQMATKKLSLWHMQHESLPANIKEKNFVGVEFEELSSESEKVRELLTKHEKEWENWPVDDLCEYDNQENREEKLKTFIAAVRNKLKNNGQQNEAFLQILGLIEKMAYRNKNQIQNSIYSNAKVIKNLIENAGNLKHFDE